MNWIILVLLLSTHAREQLQHLPYEYDYRACLVGEKQDDHTIRIDSLVPIRRCIPSLHVFGMVHAHILNEDCRYYLLGTTERTHDGYVAQESPYPMDAIACPSKMVWINKAGTVFEVSW